MFTGLLPGIREIRTPLAAGYLWLVFAFFVAGSPETAKDAPGPVEDLLEAIKPLGAAATTVTLSFAAYLVGSLLTDASRLALSRGTASAAAALQRRGGSDRVDPLRLAWVNARLVFDGFDEVAGEVAADATTPDVANAEWDQFRSRAPQAVAELMLQIQEARRQGASASETPEARRPMLEAEEDLRTAIAPPLVAIFGYLTFEYPLVGCRPRLHPLSTRPGRVPPRRIHPLGRGSRPGP